MRCTNAPTIDRHPWRLEGSRSLLWVLARRMPGLFTARCLALPKHAKVTAVSDISRSRGGAPRVVHDPLVRTATPLILNTGFNGILGVAYWMAAARLYDEEAVATNTAVLAAMTTLSGIAQLNLSQGLNVLVPRAGDRARTVVARSYAAVTGFGVMLVGLFIGLVLPHLTELSQALDSPSRLWLFAVGVLALNIFALQDAALISLRRGKLVPLENLAFGISKLALLFPLLALAPFFGIYLSWVAPMLVIIPVVSWVIFKGHQKRTSAPPSGQPRSISKLGLDYLGYLFQISSGLLLPVVALEMLEPSEAAVFAIAWQTSMTLDLLGTNLGTALTVESSYGRDPGALRRTALRHGLLLVSTVAALAIVVTPLLLSLYGSSYREAGVGTMQLLFLACVPRALGTFAVAEARAHGSIRFIVWFRALNSAVALALSFVLAPRMGVEGMALAWLVAQVLGAVVALVRMWSRSRLNLHDSGDEDSRRVRDAVAPALAGELKPGEGVEDVVVTQVTHRGRSSIYFLGTAGQPATPRWVVKRPNPDRTQLDLSSPMTVDAQWQAVRLLHARLRDTGAPVSTPRPIAYVPDVDAFVMEFASGPTLFDLLKVSLVLQRESLLESYGRGGKALRALHAVDAGPEETFEMVEFTGPLEDEARATLAEAGLAAQDHWFAHALGPGIGRRVLLHGDWAPENVLLENGTVQLLDPELVTRSWPEHDVARFIVMMSDARLFVMALDLPPFPAVRRQAVAAFLTGYYGDQPVPSTLRPLVVRGLATRWAKRYVDVTSRKPRTLRARQWLLRRHFNAMLDEVADPDWPTRT